MNTPNNSNNSNKPNKTYFIGIVICIIVLIVLFVLVGLSKTGKGCGNKGNANKRTAARVGVASIQTSAPVTSMRMLRSSTTKWVEFCNLYKNNRNLVDDLTKDQKDVFISGCNIIENDGNYVKTLEDIIKTDNLKIETVLKVLENKNTEMNRIEKDDDELIKKLLDENMTGEDDFDNESDNWDFDSIEDVLNDDTAYPIEDDMD